MFTRHAFDRGVLSLLACLLIGAVASSKAETYEDLIRYTAPSEVRLDAEDQALLWCAREGKHPVAVRLTDTLREVFSQHIDRYKARPCSPLSPGVQEIGRLPVTKVYFKTRTCSGTDIWYLDQAAVIRICSSPRGAGRQRLVISFGELHDLYEPAVVYRPAPIYLQQDEVVELQESLLDGSLSALLVRAE